MGAGVAVLAGAVAGVVITTGLLLFAYDSAARFLAWVMGG